jgi:hypothetical protein
LFDLEWPHYEKESGKKASLFFLITIPMKYKEKGTGLD